MRKLSAKCASASRGRWLLSRPRINARTGRQSSSKRRSMALCPLGASTARRARRSRRRSSIVSCSRWATLLPSLSTDDPAFTRRSPRRRKPCVGAAAWAMTFLRFVPRARWCAAPPPAPRGRCRTCGCSTVRAKPWNRQARAGGRRWACCAAPIPTSKNSSTPKTRAIWRISISRSASPTLLCAPSRPTKKSNSSTRPSRAKTSRSPVLTSSMTVSGSTARSRRATCGRRSCVRPTITPSRASSSLTA